MSLEMQVDKENANNSENTVISNPLATKEDLSEKDSGADKPPEQLPQKQQESRLKLTVILCFAFCGNFAVQIARVYPSGFYLEFLNENHLDKTIGTIAISSLLITMGVTPYLATKMPLLQRTGLVMRCLLMCFISFACNVMLAGIDKLVEVDPDGVAAFAVLGVVRGIQGVSSGVLFVIVQGEVVDLYFKGKNLMIVVISSAMHLGSMAGAIVGAEAYISGRWMLAGPTLGILMLLPVLFLPVFSPAEKTGEVDREQLSIGDKETVGVGEVVIKQQSNGELEKENQGAGELENENQGAGELEKENQSAGELGATENGGLAKTETHVRLTRLQLLVYYIPDMAVFVNNIVFNMLIYVLPVRMVEFSSVSLSSAVLFMNLLNLFSFISSLLLGYLTNKKFDVFPVMIVGNMIYYMGCAMCFGSTTEFLSFPFSFEIGSVLVGFGDAAIVNLCIRSKFALYEKWGISLEGVNLGKQATVVFQVMMSLSSVVGVMVSGMTTSRASEVPTLGVSAAAFVAVSASLIICKIV